MVNGQLLIVSAPSGSGKSTIVHYLMKEHPEFRMPFIIKNHSGRQMMQRLDNLIKMLKAGKHEFVTFNEFVSRHS